MATAISRIITPIPQEAKEFSDWHERCVEHLLHQSGHHVKREPLMMGKTPDLLATPPGGQPFIVECMARLQDPEHAREMAQQGWHDCDGNIRELHRNVYSRLDEKATRYRAIAQEMPYVIALHDATCNNGISTAVDLVLSPYAPAIERDEAGRVKGKSTTPCGARPASQSRSLSCTLICRASSTPRKDGSTTQWRNHQHEDGAPSRCKDPQ